MLLQLFLEFTCAELCGSFQRRRLCGSVPRARTVPGGEMQLFLGGRACICKHFLQLCAHFKASHRVWNLSCTEAEFSSVISDT